jgi:hypothetical protein
VIAVSNAGAIAGHVTPNDVATSVFGLLGADTVQSTMTAGDGTFLLGALPAGSYGVAFHPAAGWRDTTLSGVTVTARTTTDVGEVKLTPQ